MYYTYYCSLVRFGNVDKMNKKKKKISLALYTGIIGTWKMQVSLRR